MPECPQIPDRIQIGWTRTTDGDLVLYATWRDEDGRREGIWSDGVRMVWDART